MGRPTYRTSEYAAEATWANRLDVAEPMPPEQRVVHGIGYVSMEETTVIPVHTTPEYRRDLPA